MSGMKVFILIAVVVSCTLANGILELTPLGCSFHYQVKFVEGGQLVSREVKGFQNGAAWYTRVDDAESQRTVIRRTDLQQCTRFNFTERVCITTVIPCSETYSFAEMPVWFYPFSYYNDEEVTCPDGSSGCWSCWNSPGKDFFITDKNGRLIHYSNSSAWFNYTYLDDAPPSLDDFSTGTICPTGNSPPSQSLCPGGSSGVFYPPSLPCSFHLSAIQDYSTVMDTKGMKLDTYDHHFISFNSPFWGLSIFRVDYKQQGKYLRLTNAGTDKCSAEFINGYMPAWLVFESFVYDSMQYVRCPYPEQGTGCRRFCGTDSLLCVITDSKGRVASYSYFGVVYSFVYHEDEPTPNDFASICDGTDYPAPRGTVCSDQSDSSEDSSLSGSRSDSSESNPSTSSEQSAVLSAATQGHYMKVGLFISLLSVLLVIVP